MLFYLRVYGVKLITSVFNYFARRFLYYKDAPRAGEEIRDVSYGDSTKNRLDILAPPQASSLPVVIFFHGGGWISGTKGDRRGICREIAHHGYVVFNVDYRLAPKYTYPQQMGDVAGAVHWVSSHAGQYGGDPSRIFLMGDSAGAHLACWYAVALNEQAMLKCVGIKETIDKGQLAGLFLFYGIYDLTALEDDADIGKNQVAWRTAELITRSFLGDDPELFEDRAAVASPILKVKNGLPFTFLSAGEADPLYTQSKDLARVLKANRIPHRTLFFSRKEYPNAFHGFLNFQYKRCTRKAMNAVIEVMNTIGKKGRPARGAGSGTKGGKRQEGGRVSV